MHMQGQQGKRWMPMVARLAVMGKCSYCESYEKVDEKLGRHWEHPMCPSCWSQQMKNHSSLLWRLEKHF